VCVLAASEILLVFNVMCMLLTAAATAHTLQSFASFHGLGLQCPEQEQMTFQNVGL